MQDQVIVEHNSHGKVLEGNFHPLEPPAWHPHGA